MFSVLLVSNPSTKVVENPFQVKMPATIEGVVASLSEVVKGLVNTVQQQSALLQAHTTASTSQANSADTGSNIRATPVDLTITDLTATLQQPTRDFAQKVTSRGGVLVARAYI